MKKSAIKTKVHKLTKMRKSNAAHIAGFKNTPSKVCLKKAPQKRG